MRFATAVVGVLQVSLASYESLSASSPANIEVYDLILRGRFLYNLANEENNSKAVAYFERATRLDPASAVAWAWLSQATSEWASYGRSWAQYRPAALRAVERSLSLDPKLVAAHVALARIKLFDWNLRAAELEANEALDLAPSDSFANMIAGDAAYAVGNVGKSLKLYQRALESDPLNHFIYSRLVDVYDAMGQISDAESSARMVLELSPTYQAFAHSVLGVLMIRAGQVEDGLAEVKREPDPQDREWGLQRAAYCRISVLKGRGGCNSYSSGSNADVQSVRDRSV